MRCIKCGNLADKVIDSRQSKDGTSIRRRRECLECDYRYTTYETIERTELMVRKNDGSREPLKKAKIVNSFNIACEKRAVGLDVIARAVDDILHSLHSDHLQEVPSKNIGIRVVEKLREIDPVAFIRYVSVYRNFENVNEFLEEVRKFESRSQRDRAQGKLFAEK